MEKNLKHLMTFTTFVNESKLEKAILKHQGESLYLEKKI